MMKIYVINCTLGYLFSYMDVNLLNANKPISIPTRIFNKFRETPSIPESIETYRCLSDADVVILFGSTARFVERCNHIEKFVNGKASLHLYLWNPLKFYVDDSKELSKRWKIWSFSKDDAETLKIGYAETLYNHNLVEDADIKTDLFFVGLNKGRIHQIEMLRQVSQQQNLIADMNVVNNIKCRFSKKYVSRMSYPEVRRRIAETKAIVDVTQDNQQGMTQRVMEALFFKKKLITNNKFVMTCSFYTPSNIFILGKDNISDLTHFINSPYEDKDGFDADIYDVRNWLNRIVNNLDFHE